MGQIETTSGWAWSDVEKAWGLADKARDTALDSISEVAKAVAMVGRLLLARRHQAESQAEFELQLSRNTGLAPDVAKRCMKVHQDIATKRIDAADHASVRQLLLDVGLMPDPEKKGQPILETAAPLWVRITSKLDAKLTRLDDDQKAGLREWCKRTLDRLG